MSTSPRSPRRRTTWRALIAVAVGALALCSGCDYGEVVVVQPAAIGRGPLTLSIQADSEDIAVARALGWTAGIPGAEVTVSPANADTATGPPIIVLQTDASGKVTVPDLPDGNYLVEVRRLLTSDEMARLPPAEDVIGFMANTVVQRGDDTVLTPASHRRSIVISEWAFNAEWILDAGQTYYYGGFLELTNNSDTTVYLDGLALGEAYAKDWQVRPGYCEASEFVTTDPDGVWARFFDSVPGTGRTYPLAPGATAVIATDGIDHSGIVPGGIDLSHADFEFIGDADVDNPGVPNMVDLTVKYWRFYPHGLAFYYDNSVTVAFVALPLDIASLPMTPEHNYVRVPRDRILDVVAGTPRYQFSWEPCPHLVHENFDRHPARIKVSNYKRPEALSGQRKIAYTRADGRKILQHTRSGITDFFVAPRTPWQLP